MSSIAAIGETHRVEAFVLGGVEVHAVEDDDAVREAWELLGPDVAVLIVTPRAAGALATVRDRRADLLWAVMPG